MDEQTLKTNFLAYLQAKSATPLAIAHFPDKLLDMGIRATMGDKRNDLPVAEALPPDKVYSYVYDRWRFHYEILLNAYLPNSQVHMTVGPSEVTPKNVFDHKGKFESLFSAIDEQHIFTEVEF